ncbi:unnamed protein product [Triticum turgidum subsp. durum]|uniref:Uncharacterized protein n=1 Tax=Triticum turgidum subsp. durum TaxID=4567 RepID=A0A9R0TST0_TRITD|nr:unnamed protein product [Triticum turgidum subsp. durum]
MKDSEFINLQTTCAGPISPAPAVKTIVAIDGVEESIDRIGEILEEALRKARLGPRRFPTAASSRNMAARSPTLPDIGLFQKHGDDSGAWNEGRTGMGRWCRWRQRR